MINVGGTAIFWNSSKQCSVALFSTETEFVTATETSKMILRIRGLLKEFDFVIDRPTVMNMDSQVAIHWETGEVRQAKHVAI